MNGNWIKFRQLDASAFIFSKKNPKKTTREINSLQPRLDSFVWMRKKCSFQQVHPIVQNMVSVTKSNAMSTSFTKINLKLCQFKLYLSNGNTNEHIQYRNERLFSEKQRKKLRKTEYFRSPLRRSVYRCMWTGCVCCVRVFFLSTL